MLQGDTDPKEVTVMGGGGKAEDSPVLPVEARHPVIPKEGEEWCHGSSHPGLKLYSRNHTALKAPVMT